MIRGSRRPLRIAITTGDVDGVGLEVSIKALAKIGSQKGVCFYLWRAPNCSSADLRRIDRHFKRLTVSSWPEALKQAPDSSRQIIDISSNLPPSVWVETTAQASFFGHLDAMVTAPLSKTAIALSGMTDMGHTGILKRVTKSKELFMGFIGDKFTGLLATGHIPIDEVTSQLSTSRLELAVKAANNMRIVLDKRQAAKPLALLGLNPHAGEAGLIGSIEKKCPLGCHR